eukprot:c48485_g1_i1 orf=3-998(-)
MAIYGNGGILNGFVGAQADNLARCGIYGIPSFSEISSCSSSQSSSSFEKEENLLPVCDQRIVSFTKLNNELATKLDSVKVESNNLREKLRHLRESEIDLLYTEKDGFRGRGKLLNECCIASEAAVLAVIKKDPLVDALRKEMSTLTEEKRAIAAENEDLQRETCELEIALAKRMKDLSNTAAAAVVERKEIAAQRELDCDVQRLLNLVSLLTQENDRLRGHDQPDLEEKLKILTDELSACHSQNEEIATALISSKLQNQSLQEEVKRLTEALHHWTEEADLQRASSRAQTEALQQQLQKLTESMVAVAEEARSERTKLIAEVCNWLRERERE